MNRPTFSCFLAAWVLLAVSAVDLRAEVATLRESARPNIVLIMTDDQGWGQTGYYNHEILKTPNLDAMAANGLRFDRFYAGGPVCSPTRATVLTGRTHDRTGVIDHGYPLRLDEKTLPQALQQAGYATGHFGKWHLNGIRGVGVPIFADDPHSPGAFGFDTWVSTTNFFDIDPLMSRNGTIESFSGDSSAVIVSEALRFIEKAKDGDQPFFTVIWDGSPHRPWQASEEDQAPFAELNNAGKNHYGELVAFDRSVGQLRKGLRDLDVVDNTLVWYCSDNGGLRGRFPETVGGLRAQKGSVYEGGLRVPAIIEWPAVIEPRVTAYPACTTDIFPTLANLVGLSDKAMLNVIDGVSLRALLWQEIGPRSQPLGFRFERSIPEGKLQIAWIDNDYKLVNVDTHNPDSRFELYNLADDPAESDGLSEAQPERLAAMKAELETWRDSVEKSARGGDYPGGVGIDPRPANPPFWTELEQYQAYFEEWGERPEYKSWVEKAQKMSQSE